MSAKASRLLSAAADAIAFSGVTRMDLKASTTSISAVLIYLDLPPDSQVKTKRAPTGHAPAGVKSFLLLFFKKEVLASLLT
jgi:hypothetical protein